ncbi:MULTISPECIES: DUF2922 domain-containing protein [Bacillaceae]|uniref:DUF2922 domain-containing protein n=1 Tax=Evansella alkalicola TaxID=745819 RepID=A0ABS6JZZ1_9BACI|nr:MULTISPECIES: DUF2922 domain-containing protein [Bacillaceae]MBU9723254.1 DUF2922 domain-containing protein [Bacillus alkalicola]
MAKKLELQFINAGGKNVTISIDDPIEPVDSQAVSQVMDVVIANSVFTSREGLLVQKRGARIVERKVEEVQIEL